MIIQSIFRALMHFSDQDPIHMIQIDAHLDFVDERHGVTQGHGNPMRRAIEKPWVSGMTQLGIRNVSSTAKEGYEDARARGSDILSVRQVRKLGVEAVLSTHTKRCALLCHHRYRRLLPFNRTWYGHAKSRWFSIL